MSEQPPVVPAGTRGAVDLTGLSGHDAAPAAARSASSGTGEPLHVQATDATFNDAVTRSLRIPAVLVVVSTRLPESVVFLGNVIEAATALGGRLQVVSVDIDSNPALARALQVQSVPITIGLLQGQVLPMFAGPVPAEQLKAVLEEFLTVAVQQGITGRVDVGEPPASDELSPLHQAAYDAIERGDLADAVTAYEKALADNPADNDAKLGLGQVRLMQRTDGVDAQAARAAAAANPDDVQAAMTVADLDLLGGHVEDAFDRLIDLVRRTAGADRDAARTHVISLFDVVGNHDERVKKARTALMSALF